MSRDRCQLSPETRHCPRYKVKPQIRGGFRRDPKAASGVASGLVSAPCPQTLPPDRHSVPAGESGIREAVRQFFHWCEALGERVCEGDALKFEWHGAGLSGYGTVTGIHRGQVLRMPLNAHHC